MSPIGPMPLPLPKPWSLLTDRVRTWAVESQQGARRNAMIATTALAARRAERQDVDAYLAALLPREPAAPVAVRR
jgi:hypothetical protein